MEKKARHFLRNGLGPAPEKQAREKQCVCIKGVMQVFLQKDFFQLSLDKDEDSVR